MRPLNVAPDDVLAVTLYHDAALRTWLEHDADRWTFGDDVIGWPLFTMQATGHWRPFTRASRQMYAALVGYAIEAHAPEPHQGSRRVGPPSPENSNAQQASRHLW
jgi:hypothetical protein